MVELQLLNLSLLKTVLRGEKDSVMIALPGWVYVWTLPITKEAYNPECLVPTVKHGAGSEMIWVAISSILLVLYLL